MGDPLLEQWYADRGPKAKRLQPEQEAAMTAHLRARQEEIDNPKPLQFCETCKRVARGEHRVVTE
jgi:hypothetical protein